VPEGKVVSYGQLAELAGLARRPLGRPTLSQLPGDTRLPWHRVLGAGGRISLPRAALGDEQRARLRAEGVTILNNRVDIQRHGWRPIEHSG
jgi:methylated-DNA-protein-cysteine methyltransferase-like protein